MIAGVPWSWWIGFHVAVLALLGIDTLLPGRRPGAVRGQWVAWLWTFSLALAAAAFALWIAVSMGHQTALEFVAGYTIETSLSIDNLFVFLVLFQGFCIDESKQRRVLAWGVGGAIILRAIFIAAGVALLQRFNWVTYIFGLLLLYAAWKLLRGSSASAAVPEWICKLQPAAGSLLPVIIAVEITDLLFAIDSIPAVLAISHNPFVVYTSNIAAVLGLRSLYFALSGLLDRFKYLHLGLGALLAFVALKMLLVRWIEVPIVVSLCIMGTILGICGVVSWMASNKEPQRP